MYGLVDFFVAEHIMHTIVRKQAEEVAREPAQPQQMSLVGRLINRLPLWSANRLFAFDRSHEKAELNIAQCE